LGDNPGKLCGGFQQQHPWEKGVPWKMSTQERFVASHAILADSALAWIETQQSIHEAELRSVRE